MTACYFEIRKMCATLVLRFYEMGRLGGELDFHRLGRPNHHVHHDAMPKCGSHNAHIAEEIVRTFDWSFPHHGCMSVNMISSARALVVVALLSTACGKSESPKSGENAPAKTAPAAVEPAATPKKAVKTPCAPACSDATHAQVCSEDGVAALVDCAAKGRRCVRGVCAEQLCKPGALHCHEGELYKCDETGSNRKVEKKCRPDGICLTDAKTKVASCIQKCDKALQQVTLASYECEACDFKDVPFCAKTGPETSCSEAVCNGGEISYGAGMSECVRETDGLIVPGSEKKGACENATMTVQYEVCVDGKPEKRSRIDGC